MPAKRLWSWTVLMRNSNPIREKRTASWLFDGFSSLGGGHVAWDTQCQYVSNCRSETFCQQPPCRKSFKSIQKNHCVERRRRYCWFYFRSPYFLPGIWLERTECLVAFLLDQAAEPISRKKDPRLLSRLKTLNSLLYVFFLIIIFFFSFLDKKNVSKNSLRSL